MRYFWWAVDHEDEVLESFVTLTRDKGAALKFITKALNRHRSLGAIITEGLHSYRAEMKELRNTEKRAVGHRANNRCENSHLPF